MSIAKTRTASHRSSMKRKDHVESTWSFYYVNMRKGKIRKKGNSNFRRKYRQTLENSMLRVMIKKAKNTQEISKSEDEDMNKQQLANRIWESANKMRSKIEANEYKDYILGFIFYKYLSETEVKWLKEQDFTEEDMKALDESDTETVEYIQQNVGYFISYNNLYST